VRAEFFADAVHEQLNAPAPRTNVHIEVFAVGEELTDLAEKAPTRSLVELLGSHVLQLLIAPRTCHRIHGSSLYQQLFDDLALIDAELVLVGGDRGEHVSMLE
jgi:hypothetical protein